MPKVIILDERFNVITGLVAVEAEDKVLYAERVGVGLGTTERSVTYLTDLALV